MYNLVWAVVLLPLGGFLFSFLPEQPRRVAQVSVVFTAASLLAALLLLVYRLTHMTEIPYESGLTFLTFSPGTLVGGASTVVQSGATDLTLQVGVLVDNISVIMMAAVALLSLLVQVHSTAHMRGDGAYGRYFTVLSFFTFCMLGVVASNNLFGLYLMWEGVGVCSFLLIGHWWHRPRAAAAARRAFLVTRIGDLCLLLALVFGFAKFAVHVSLQQIPTGLSANDPFNLLTLAREWHLAHLGMVAGVGGRTMVLLAVLVLVAVAARAALPPLHTWISDAMEGPTPANALLHGALMAGAGVYLMARTYELFLDAPHILTVVAVVGAVAAVFGAVVALAQTDIKRLLAYSVVSNAGLMVVALGVGAFSAALFQVLTNAWFAALLFLCAANIVHAYGTRDIREMGGVWTRMPRTAVAMLVGCCSAAGVTLFAGFWSRGAVLAGVLDNRLPTGGQIDAALRALLLIAVLATVFLGAMVPFRLFFVAVLGEPARRRGFQPTKVREAPRAATAPLLPLAALAALAGFAAIPGLRATFAHVVTYAGASSPSTAMASAALIISGAVALLGVGVAYLLWVDRMLALASLPARLGRLPELAAAAFHVDAAYAWLAERVVLRPAALLPRFDRGVTEAIEEGMAESATTAAAALRRLQNGQVQAYALSGAVAVGVLALGATLMATGHFPGMGVTR